MTPILLNTAYFPPVRYFSGIKEHESVLIEQYEHYGKQSFRNRCRIMTANGILSLPVPVKKGELPKTLIRDIRIDYSEQWQKMHFRAIESAYRNAPFYEYFIDDFRAFFEKKEVFLIDLNGKILEAFLEIIPLKREVRLTEDYIKDPSGTTADFRDVIHPKISRRVREDHYTPKPYHQTFSDRFPFIPELSILDLLFNTGPEAISYL